MLTENDINEFDNWLSNQNAEIGHICATRAALRCTPTAINPVSSRLDLPNNKVRALLCLRATLTSCVSTLAPRTTPKPLESSSPNSLYPYIAKSNDDLSAAQAARSAYYASLAPIQTRAASLSIAASDRACVTSSKNSAAAAGMAAAVNLALGIDIDVMEAVEEPSRIFHYPVWHQKDPLGMLKQKDSFEHYAATNTDWDFWVRWYDAMWHGEPMDWTLQEAVALLPDEDWQAGPERIAERIKEIEARFALKNRIAELEASLAQARAGRFGIGGNSPPPEGQLDAADFAPLVQPLQVLKAEAEAEIPSKSRIQQAIDGLRAALKWVGGHIDSAIGAGMKTAGAAAGTTLVAKLAGYGDEIARVVAAAEAWLKALF